MRQLFSKGVHPPIFDILRHIFLNPNIEEILPQTGILLELTIQSHPPEIKGTLNITFRHEILYKIHFATYEMFESIANMIIQNPRFCNVIILQKRVTLAEIMRKGNIL